MNVDHIEPHTRGGSDSSDNLCFACPNCNNSKGTLVSFLDPMTEQETPLFNPRTQIWSEHFSWADDKAAIIGLTACLRATIEALRMNQPESLDFRRLMASISMYPPA
jgi:hypothetical protein